MKNNIYEKIDDLIKKNTDIQQNFTGYLPELRIKYWICAVKEFLDEILNLVELIKKEMKCYNWRIRIEVRLLLIFLRATFRLTTTQLECVLLNDKNKMLFDFLKLFSDHFYISHSEWSNRSFVLKKYDERIEKLAWKIKGRYHELYLEGYINTFLKLYKNSTHKPDLNISELLEGINFTKYFPEEILKWKNGYPTDLMCKTFVFMKLRMIPSISYLKLVINESAIVGNEILPVMGHSLGFYTRVPGIDKLYKAHRKFNVNILIEILEDNVDFLVKEGIINIETIIGDSTTCKTRKDDQDGVKYHNKDKEGKRVLKFQALVDPNCIPLTIIPCKGNENDKSGFNVLKEKLTMLKKIAEKYKLKIEYVKLDAGYCSLEILEFIEKEIEAIPIVDINPMNSEVLKEYKRVLEYFKQYLREIIKLGLKFPKLAKMCYFRFLEDIEEALKKLEKDESKIPKLALNYLKIFKNIGIEKFIMEYRGREVIEGLFGMMKGCYALLGRANRKLPLKGKNQVHKHGLFILIAMQYLAYFNYKILGKKINKLRALYYIKMKEIEVIY